MNALSWFPTPHKDSLAILFDITSATVGVAVVDYRKDKPIQVLFTHRELISYGENQDAKSLGEYVGAAIKAAGAKALEGLRTQKHSGAYTVHAVVHAPWADSESQKAESVLPSEIVITKEVLQQFMAKKLPSTPIEGHIEFDHHITQIALNGYPTKNPYQKEASQIAMTTIKSSMSEILYDCIMQAFDDVFPNHEVHMDAFLFVVTQMDEFFENQDAYTVLDIGGEYSSLTIVRDTVVVSTIGISFGTEYLVRAIMDSEQSSRHTAVSQISMYLDNTCTPSQCRKIETALEVAGQEWVRAFGDACATMSKTYRIPPHTYLAVGKRYETWFKKLIEKIDFAHFTVTGKPLEAHLFALEKGTRQLFFSKGAQRDLLLSLDVLFVDK